MASSTIFGRNFDDDILQEREKASAARRDEEYPPERVSRMIEEAAAEAYARGYDKGRTEGYEQSQGSISAESAAVSATIAPLLERILAGQADHHAAIESDMATFALSVIEKAFPQIIKGYNEDRIEAEVRSICRRAQGSRWLEIRTSTRMRSRIEELVRAGLSGSDEGKDLKVIADSGMEDSEVRAFWNGGNSSHSHAKLCRNIIETLQADIAARKKGEKENG